MIVYGIIAKYGVDGLIISTILSGVLLVVMGLMRVGSLIRFVPVAIVIGFTNGIAVLIILSQINDLLRVATSTICLQIFFLKIAALVTHMETFD